MARAKGHKEETIIDWIRAAGQHAERIEEVFWRNTRSNVASWTAYGHTFVTRVKKDYPETEETGQFWRSTMIDMNSRLRAARGIAKTETEASIGVFETLKRRGHPDAPPPTISDGWGGIDDAMVEV